MANLALPRLHRGAHRLPKWTLPLAIALAVLALMALSFLLGRVTMSDAGSAKPVVHPVVQPAGPATRGGVDCHQHEQC